MIKSIHYIGIEHDKVIRHIKRREEKVISAYRCGQKLDEQVMAIGWYDEQELKVSLEELMEQVVVKLGDEIISVYPMLTTPIQIANESWLKSDTRQKMVLRVWQEKDLLYFDVFKLGDIIADQEVSIKDAGDLEQMTFSQAAPQAILEAVLPAIENSTNLNFPIFLPQAWEHMWTVDKKTQFVSFCK